MSFAYYNENDEFAVRWLRNLIGAGHVAPGIVDDRSIEDVRPSDLRGFTQCHFFAGIGVWSLALRRAGWPDDRRVWTGSCPCQPFSAAGKGAGTADERHLWPAWFHLISQCRPDAIRGEQVASADAMAWLDLVQPDLEAADYAAGAVDFCAAGVGTPGIRQRLWIVADANKRAGGQGRSHVRGWTAGGHAQSWARPGSSSVPSRLAHPDDDGLSTLPRAGVHHAEHNAESRGGSGGTGHSDSINSGRNGSDGARTETASDCSRPLNGVVRHGADVAGGTRCLADPILQQRQDRQPRVGAEHEATGRIEGAAAAAGLRSDLRPGPTNGFWANADWLRCRDGKWRPVEPGTFPLVAGAPSRVGRLRAYGNAINAQAAEAFIRATL